jgi:hypothetical protein
MADKLTPKKIQTIVSAQKPGFEAEAETADQRASAARDRSHVQTHSPDLEYLAAKFLKGATRSQRTTAARNDAASASKASKIVRVHPAGASATDAVGTGSRKVVVVSAKDEKIVGEQG